MEMLAQRVAERLAAKAVAEGPLPPLILAIRSARQAIVENPRNPDAYLVLGDAYLHLMATTREMEWAARLPLLNRLRKVQTIAAFRQALLLNADLVPAHLNLARLFHEMGYLDLALKHYQTKHRKRLQEVGRQGNETQEVFDQTMRTLDTTASLLLTEVGERQNDMRSEHSTFESARQSSVKREDEGCWKRPSTSYWNRIMPFFGPSGLYMEMDLLLTTGKVAEVYQWLVPDHKTPLGDNHYFSLLAQLHAAVESMHKEAPIKI